VADDELRVADERKVTLAEELRGQTDAGLGVRLQDIVEEASRAFGRPVAIDDRHSRLLAYTEHPPDELDPVRVISILEKRAPAEALAWIEDHGIRTAEAPVVVPANPALGLDARICAPIRCHDHLLGFLWLIDRDRSMAAADLERARALADEAGIVLYREMLLRDLDRSREQELVRDILADDEQVRRQGVAQLAETELFTARSAVAAIVAPLPILPDGRSAAQVRIAADAAVARARRHLAPKHGLHLVRPDHALLVVALADPGLRVNGTRPFAAGLRAELDAACPPEPGERRLVAIGGAVPGLIDAAHSYHQAQRAARVAAAMPSFGDVVSWDELGVYKMLVELPLDALGSGALHPGLRALIENPRTHFLVRTLECYLAHAGDTQATAKDLHVHRTSLYHRLRRVEQLATVDLASGEERLVLHLGLKVARLQGLTWAAGADDGPKRLRQM
jgi:PucR C-terminal helix-turn-helix domain/GGDEF-like domain